MCFLFTRIMWEFKSQTTGQTRRLTKPPYNLDDSASASEPHKYVLDHRASGSNSYVFSIIVTGTCCHSVHKQIHDVAIGTEENIHVLACHGLSYLLSFCSQANTWCSYWDRRNYTCTCLSWLVILFYCDLESDIFIVDISLSVSIFTSVFICIYNFIF